MGIAALVAWVLTALGGFVMLGMWVARGGHRQPNSSKFPPGLIFGHFALAAVGLVLWIVYLVAGGVFGWVALALLVPVAALGFTMLARWIPTYRASRTAVAAGAKGGAQGAGATPPEGAFPTPVVGMHGVLAVTTVVLALLAVLGMGGG